MSRNIVPPESAIHRFHMTQSDSPKYFLDDGLYKAFVTYAAGSWVWLVMENGNPIDHGGGLNLSAYEACDDAADALKSARASASRPYFVDSI